MKFRGADDYASLEYAQVHITKSIKSNTTINVILFCCSVSHKWTHLLIPRRILFLKKIFVHILSRESKVFNHAYLVWRNIREQVRCSMCIYSYVAINPSYLLILKRPILGQNEQLLPSRRTFLSSGRII